MYFAQPSFCLFEWRGVKEPLLLYYVLEGNVEENQKIRFSEQKLKVSRSIEIGNPNRFAPKRHKTNPLHQAKEDAQSIFLVRYYFIISFILDCTVGRKKGTFELFVARQVDCSNGFELEFSGSSEPELKIFRAESSRAGAF